jgi:hypothetical protein
MALSDLLVGTVLVGLAAGGVASIFRALPWPKTWLTQKPLGCPLCMGWWAALFIVTAIQWTPTKDSAELLTRFAPFGTNEMFFQLLGATAIAAWLTAQIIQPPIELPTFPEA